MPMQFGGLSIHSPRSENTGENKVGNATQPTSSPRFPEGNATRRIARTGPPQADQTQGDDCRSDLKTVACMFIAPPPLVGEPARQPVRDWTGPRERIGRNARMATDPCTRSLSNAGASFWATSSVSPTLQGRPALESVPVRPDCAFLFPKLVPRYSLGVLISSTPLPFWL
jgi:hypothetical protein